MIIGRCRENGTIACTFQCVYNPACNMLVCSICCNDLVGVYEFVDFMKTAEDLKRLITTGFSNKKWHGSAHIITT